MSTPPQTRESTGASSRLSRCLWFIGVVSIVWMVLVIVLASWHPAWMLRHFGSMHDDMILTRGRP